MADAARDRPLAGAVAIVTGAGQGIGRAEALALAAAGARVVVNDLPAGADGIDHAKAAVDEIRAAGGEAIACQDSVTTFAAGRRIVSAAMDTFGRLDILVNNAGFAKPALISEMSEAQWDEVIAVHLKGHFNTTRHAAPIFRQQRSGTIINTASESGLGHYGMANYAAAKEGIVAFTRSIARELSQFNVRCYALRPRAATGMGSPELFETLRYSQDVLGIAIHGNRWVHLDELNPPAVVGRFVVWLCTATPAGANGRTFFVGGDTIGLYSDPELTRSLMKPGGWSLDDLNARATTAYLLDGLTDRFRGKQP